MLVKVNERYKGVFGQYDAELSTVHAKRAGDPPFTVADDVAERQIAAGVLVPAEEKPKAKDGWKDQAKRLGIPYVGKKKDEVERAIEERLKGEEAEAEDAEEGGDVPDDGEDAPALTAADPE